MAGHSKWANIKHRKEGADRRRGILYHKLTREIMVAAKLGGSDPTSNNRLRIAVARARAANVARDTIERAVKKGAGELEGQTFEEVTYEAYAAGGVGIIVEAVTDKRTRTTPEIKNIINKHGGSLAEPNAVACIFRRAGYISVPRTAIQEEPLFEMALEAGAEDIRTDDAEHFEIITLPEDFATVSEAMSEKQIQTEESGVRYLPLDGTEVTVNDPDQARTALKLIEALEEHDDVQAVYTNLNISDEALVSLSE